jgi:AraC family transcriptional regulator, activator of mtrCDE
LLERRYGEPLQLQAGHLLLLPRGDAHVVRSAAPGGRIGAPIRIEFNNAVRIKTNTEDKSDTELICGRLKFHAVESDLHWPPGDRRDFGRSRLLARPRDAAFRHSR